MSPCLNVDKIKYVVAAIKEFEEIGREEFLSKYGFGHAREYFIEYKGTRYDCKAILVAAYYHQFEPDLLVDGKEDEFKKHLEKLKTGTGGVAPRIEQLLIGMGFKVVNDGWKPPLLGGFPEGKKVERVHKARERSAKLIRVARETFLENHEKLYCIVCGFDFEKVYGERGQGYIEAHHTVPVSEMKVGYKTKPEEIALVCSNCHRMLHRTRPWLKMDELENLLNDI
jgi:hypothetical protein